MKLKKRYIIIPLVVIFIIILGIGILIKLDRDYQKKVIDQEEAEYGNEYLKLEESLSYYTGNPERIIYKPKMKDYFYVIDKNDEDYAHLLEVAEDRMSYSLMTPLTDDFNVDSMDRIMSSGKNYIILDYDKEKYANIGVDDGTIPRPVVYKLLDDNRCARLFKYVTQFKKRYTVEELEEILGKKGFSINDAIEDPQVQEDIDDGYTMIYTIDDFRRIANNPSGKYKLVNDLDLEGDTILYTTTGFTGELDGNGHTIKNITKNLANDETERIAMFYTNEGTIKNLNIENINIISDKDTSYAEGIIAQVNKGTIENCTISGNVTITSETDNNSIGGIVVNTNKTTYQGILAGAKSSKATIDPSTGYGHNYDFETYYEEHAMETLND